MATSVCLFYPTTCTFPLVFTSLMSVCIPHSYQSYRPTVLASMLKGSDTVGKGVKRLQDFRASFSFFLACWNSAVHSVIPPHAAISSEELPSQQMIQAHKPQESPQ